VRGYVARRSAVAVAADYYCGDAGGFGHEQAGGGGEFVGDRENRGVQRLVV